MLRDIIKIDYDLCNGCGECVPSCFEGALQVIDGKVRLISDLFCDGLGACIGHCPEGALTIEKREAEPYNEYRVMEEIVKGGANVIKAHLLHLKEHEEFEYLKQGLAYLREHDIPVPELERESRETVTESQCGCPGSQEMSFEVEEESENVTRISPQLRQWPVQLHLVPPTAPYFHNSDLLLTADCVPFAYPNYHSDFLKGKSLAIACPKLDSNQDIYVEKLAMMITEANVKSITVLIMQVPCCSGLYRIAQQAIHNSGKNIPLHAKVIGVRGEILQEV